MPKIIDDVRGKLLCETRAQIDRIGYGAVTVRSVASAVHVSVGTVYNYFPSKDVLIASVLLDDWQKALSALNVVEENGSDRLLASVYDTIQTYIKDHAVLFSDAGAKAVFQTSGAAWHPRLREQIAQLLSPALPKKVKEKHTFLAEFIAEALLSWAVEEKPYEALRPIFQSLLK